jgi:hypothetical protein
MKNPIDRPTLWWEEDLYDVVPVACAWPRNEGSFDIELTRTPVEGDNPDWLEVACMREQAWAIREGLA